MTKRLTSVVLRPETTINLLILLILLAWAPVAWAQVRPVGQIVGVVQDPAGAVIPGAEVKVEDEATGASQNRKSGPDGGFVFLNLQVGTYKITVSMPGFRTGAYPGLKVDAARATNLTVT